jgi:hypothetical protein
MDAVIWVRGSGNRRQVCVEHSIPGSAAIDPRFVSRNASRNSHI